MVFINLAQKKKEIFAKGNEQGVWKRREIQMTRPALPYDYTCYADGTPF